MKNKNRTKNNKCIDCKTLIDDRAKRCRMCYNKWSNILGNGSNFKNRRVELKCSYCHKIVQKNLSQIIENRPIFCDSICMGLYRKESYKGDNNPAWIDGSSYENYPKEFTESLRELIHKRDDYTCQNCSMTEEEHLIVYGRVIEVHHIDYNKDNCKEINLITLCKQCNLRANSNRDYWQEIYNSKIKITK